MLKISENSATSATSTAPTIIQTSALDEPRVSEDPTNKNQLMEALRFYLLVSTLQNKIRSGWDDKHWNVTASRLESVAEHCFKACILAISIYATGDKRCADINICRVMIMLILHEIGEALIGDITPFDGITPTEKAQIETQAVIDVTGNLSARERIIDILTEFEARSTEDAKFAHLCDKLEADLQAKVYQDQGYFHPLGQEGNDFLASTPEAQQIIANGAKTPFDLWYEYDKHRYQDAPPFADLLDLARDNDLADLLVDYLAPHKVQS